MSKNGIPILLFVIVVAVVLGIAFRLQDPDPDSTPTPTPITLTATLTETVDTVTPTSSLQVSLTSTSTSTGVNASNMPTGSPDTPTPTNTPDASATAILTVNNSPMTLTFYSLPANDEHNIEEVPVRFEESGTYQLRLANANSLYSGHWMIWDYILLRSAGGEIIWIIGENEDPDVFDNSAFDEFCDKSSGSCSNSNVYVIGTTESILLVREINDNDVTELFIEFEIEDTLLEQELLLTVSTLFSSHDNVSGFDLELSLYQN